MKRLLWTALAASSALAISMPAHAQPVARDTAVQTFDQLLSRCLTLAGYGAGSTDQVCDALASVVSGGLPMSAVAGSLAGGSGSGLTTSLPPNLTGGGSGGLPSTPPAPPEEPTPPETTG